MPKGERKGKVGGLQLSADDLKWLNEASRGAGSIPPFNKSRLIAHGLVESPNGRLLITEKGKKLLATPQPYMAKISPFLLSANIRGESCA